MDLPSIKVMRRASQVDGSRIIDTGTAVTTMKLCSLSMPPSPLEIKINDITPIAKPQKVRNPVDGSPLDMLLEMT